MFGDFKEKQEEMLQKLAAITVEAEAGDDAVIVEANANKEIINITIDNTKVDLSDKEQLEDLILIAVNRAIELAKSKEQEATQNMIQDLLPPGMGDLGNLFE
ncbi:MAG: YbaB/EbfC family nucleoid-associated protein [Bacteroidota bacterium]